MQIPFFPQPQPTSSRPDVGKRISESALSKRDFSDNSLKNNNTNFKKSLRDDELRNEQAADRRLADERRLADHPRQNGENRVADEKRPAEKAPANEPVQQPPRKKAPTENNPVGDNHSASTNESIQVTGFRQPTIEKTDSAIAAVAGVQPSEISAQLMVAAPIEDALGATPVTVSNSSVAEEAISSDPLELNPLVASHTINSHVSATVAPVQQPQTQGAENATTISANQIPSANQQTSATQSIAAVSLPKPKELADTETTSDERRENVASVDVTVDLEDSPSELNSVDADAPIALDHFHQRHSESSGNSLPNAQTFNAAAGQASAAVASLVPETSARETTSTSGIDLNLTMSAAQVAEKFNPATRSVVQSVINQVTETIASDTISFSSTMNELGNRQLTLEINPPELGRLEIKIDSAENILTAHIIASESITSEMLTREKSQLIEALKEQGIDLPDVNISHRNSREQNQSENQSNRDEAGRFSNSRIAPRSAANPTSQIPYLVNSDPSRINLVA